MGDQQSSHRWLMPKHRVQFPMRLARLISSKKTKELLTFLEDEELEFKLLPQRSCTRSWAVWPEFKFIEISDWNWPWFWSWYASWLKSLKLESSNNEFGLRISADTNYQFTKSKGRIKSNSPILIVFLTSADLDIVTTESSTIFSAKRALLE
jgi:hypothetical protein